MNDEMISGLGGFCSELLNSADFDALTKLYSQQCAVDILNTEPKATREREAIYAAYQGFEGFLALMKKFSDAHDKLREQQNHSDEGVQDLDDESVHDIYRS